MPSNIDGLVFNNSDVESRAIKMKEQIKKRMKSFLLKTLWRYDQKKLCTALQHQGIKKGSRLMIHSTWRPDNGFDGSAKEFIDVLKELVGEEGMIIMMSMPYHDQSTADYLAEKKLFKVKRTASKVGLLSEVFRRGKNVLRSRNAAHPFLVWGEGKEALIKDHENSVCSFGHDSPFAKFEDLGCEILLIDTPFNSTTYNHYIESLYEERFPVPLFDKQMMQGEIEDTDGTQLTFSTKVLSKASGPYRIDNKLESALKADNKVNQFKVGHTNFILVKSKDLIDVASSCIIF